MFRFLVAAILVVGALSLNACSILGTSPDEADFTYSFEDNPHDWTARGIDLVVDDREVEWAVEHTSEVGHEAPGAVRLYLENDTDAGKIWMERSFSLAPNQRYDVRVSYAFGTSDYGDVNLWTLLAGAHRNAPETHDDHTFHEETGTGTDEDVGLVWLEKNYSLTAETDEEGTLYVTVGVWGTYEVSRTYYIDDLRIDFEPRE